jgi:hypothetical protein
MAPIEFDDEDEKEAKIDMTSSRVHQASSAMLGQSSGWDDTKFQRPLDPRGIAATRTRTFHSKLTDSAFEYMNNQINEWLDRNENITVKFANSTIGMYEGKHTEPHVILTLFY